MAKKLKNQDKESKYIASVFARNRKIVEKLRSREKQMEREPGEGDYKEEWHLLDFDDHRLLRRRKATERYLDKAKALAAELGLKSLLDGDNSRYRPDIYSFAARWAHYNSFMMWGYDEVNKNDGMTTAAAIWMLDRIAEYDEVPFLDANGEIATSKYGLTIRRTRRLLELLPPDDGSIDDVQIPHIWDPCHSEQIILETVALIEHRNRDCRVRNPEKDFKRWILDTATVEGTQHQDVPSRTAFEAVLSLIPEEEKQRALETAEKVLWDCAERYLSVFEEYGKCQDNIARKLRALEEELEERVRRTTRESGQKAKGAKSSAPLRAPLAMAAPLMNQGQGFPLPTGELPYMNDSFAAIERMEQQCEDLTNELEWAMKQENKLLFHLGLYMNYSRAQLFRMALEDLGNEAAANKVADLLSGFPAVDPYELCFGLLYLIDSGSDLPFLYLPGTAAARLAAAHLPWYHGSYDEWEDEYWSGEENEEEKELPPQEKVRRGEERVRLGKLTHWELPKSLRAPKLHNWYALDYADKSAGDDFAVHSSLSQIIYDITGGIMPRNMTRYELALEELNDYGIRGQKALPFEYAMLLMGQAQRQTVDWRTEFPDLLSYEAASTPEDEFEEDSTEDVEKLKAQLATLKKECARLSDAAYSADREMREERKKNERLTAETEQERKELYALREILFAQEQGEEEDTDLPQLQELLPYKVEHRMVVFGGHDSWARAIVPMLQGSIRFVERGMRPSPDLIRNSDVIWIQTNCLSHKDYYAIMNVVRAHKKQVEYFRYASAGKCAMQVMEMDKALE